MGIGRLRYIEGTLREVVGHDGAVKHPLPAFARRNSREQKCQKVQKITGKITVVSRYDQPADGVLLHDFIGFILQSLGIDWFVDEARILFQHGGKDLFEGRYSPKWPDGEKHARNVYAHTREECEEKLKVLIVEMKAEIAEAKRLINLEAR